MNVNFFKGFCFMDNLFLELTIQQYLAFLKLLVVGTLR